MSAEQFDLVVIGGGPGGYTAAVRAAKLGMRAVLIERQELGGTCLNRGCIPTAAMLHSAGLCRQLRESERFGICAEGVSVDYPKLLAYRRETVQMLVQGVEQMLDIAGVARLSGTGTLLPGRRARVTSEDGDTVLTGKNILLATGSKARVPDIPGVDLPGVADSDGALAWESIPDSLTVIGGGVIGVEYAQIFADLGSCVTLLGTRARLLPSMDREIGQSLKMVLKKRGVDVRTGVTVERIERDGELLRCRFTEKEEKKTVTSQKVLYAVGRVPYTDGLFEGAAPEMAGGRIAVNEHFETSIPGVYAIGDVIGGPQLAHLAMAQGTTAAERMAGLAPSVDVATVPYCVYTDPEIVSVGLTEAQAKEKGVPVRTGKCVLGGNGRSAVSREERGFMWLVTDRETGKLLGAQLMCARAGDMAGELVSAVSNGFTAEQLMRAIRPHPTYNEALSEALRASVIFS